MGQAKARLLSAPWIGITFLLLGFWSARAALAGTVEYTQIDEAGRKTTVRKPLRPGETIVMENPLARQKAPQQRPWVAEVSSTYSDQTTGEARRVSGGGTLVSYKDGWSTRYFIQTASHVSQGQQLKLKLPDTSVASLEVVGRYSDNLADVEFVEVRSPALKPEMALASYDAKAGRFYVDQAWVEGWNTLALNRAIHQGNSVFLPGPSQAVGFDGALTLPLQQSAQAALPASRMWLVEGGRELAIDTWTEPGTSGQALVVKGNDFALEGRWVFAGPALRSSRHFPVSFFPSPNTVSQTFVSLLKGERTSSEVQWNMRNGLTYRKVGKDGAEIVDGNSLLIGNGSDRDGGNGSDRDGGNGSDRDGGGGARRSGPIGRTDPVAVWKNLGIQPGIVWKGEPTLALRVSRDGQSAVLFGSPSALLLIRDRLQPESSYLIERLPAKPDLIELMKQKAGLGAQAGSFRLESRAGSTVEVQGDEIRIRVVRKTGTIELRLARDGQLLAPPADRFYPIVRAKDSSGQEHTIDLRDLFFTEVSSLENTLQANVGLAQPCGRDCGSKPMAWTAAEFNSFVAKTKAPVIRLSSPGQRVSSESFSLCSASDSKESQAACVAPTSTVPEEPVKLRRNLDYILKE